MGGLNIYQNVCRVHTENNILIIYFKIIVQFILMGWCWCLCLYLCWYNIYLNSYIYLNI